MPTMAGTIRPGVRGPQQGHGMRGQRTSSKHKDIVKEVEGLGWGLQQTDEHCALQAQRQQSAY